MDYVGCNLEKFRILLEIKFYDGMSWDNYGKNINGGNINTWQIYHKIPCNAFDMTNEIHKRAFFHYKNLQPLWWNDNIKKKDHYTKIDLDNYIKWYIDIYNVIIHIKLFYS